jgi:hypothetical protein
VKGNDDKKERGIRTARATEKEKEGEQYQKRSIEGVFVFLELRQETNG